MNGYTTNNFKIVEPSYRKHSPQTCTQKYNKKNKRTKELSLPNDDIMMGKYYQITPFTTKNS